MKKYAIVLDKNGDVRVIPSKWLTDNKSAIFWPPLKQKSDINDAVIYLRDVSKDWSKYSITKYIKSNDNYVDAIKGSRLQNLENLTNASDDDKLKKTRSARNKKSFDLEEPVKKKSKLDKREEEESSSESDEEIEEKEKEDNESNSEESGSESLKKNNSSLYLGPINETISLPPKTLKVVIPRNSTGVKDKSTETTSSTSTKHVQPNARDIAESGTSSRGIEEASASQDEGNNSFPTDENLKNMTDRQILVATFGLMKKTGKVTIMAIKINNLNQRVEGMKGERNVSNDSIELSFEDLDMMNKYFPIDNIEGNKDKKIDVVEKKLTEKNRGFFNTALRFFRGKEGLDCKKLIYNIMSAAMTNKVADQFSFTGRKAPRKVFNKLLLCTCVYHACKLTFKNVDDDTIKSSISSWLDTANTRLKREESGQASSRIPFKPLPMESNDIDSVDDSDE